ncbi:ATP-grasp domain-containing protein [Sphingomicrobium arenosum]|uniref:glutathione synthase n=1 Tax=Sphingomicrobium arenosum TaxID=2233861 RepID=UPI00223F8831|nr:glutathione synthase [Sphingomicrobium arenosum]
MKIAFVVNRVATEQENYSSSRMGRVALARGHEVALIELGQFIYDADGSICAHAIIAPQKRFQSDATYLEAVKSVEPTRIRLDDYDILLLRSDPADELGERPWAPASALLFGQLAAKNGPIVLNDPSFLTDAVNKTYFQHFPEKVRPRTCITRSEDEVRAFLETQGGKAVIKPLQGSGGQGVFVLDEDNRQNLSQTVEAVTRDGYAIVQEYLAGAADGDIRLITLNGRPLVVDGTYACLRRYNESEDARSNISAGGKTEMIEPTDDVLRVAELVAPKLIADGMYLAGLDIVGDKMMEANVDTPGAISYMDDASGKDFTGAIIDDLERKVRLREGYGGRLSNRQLAMI